MKLIAYLNRSIVLIRHSGFRFRRSYWSVRPYGSFLDPLRILEGFPFLQINPLVATICTIRY